MILDGIELAVAAAAMAELDGKLAKDLVLERLEKRQRLERRRRRLVHRAVCRQLDGADGFGERFEVELQHAAIGTELRIIDIQHDKDSSKVLQNCDMECGMAQQPMSRSFLPDMRFFSISSSVTFFVSGTKPMVRKMKTALSAA